MEWELSCTWDMANCNLLLLVAYWPVTASFCSEKPQILLND